MTVSAYIFIGTLFLAKAVRLEYGGEVMTKSKSGARTDDGR